VPEAAPRRQRGGHSRQLTRRAAHKEPRRSSWSVLHHPDFRLYFGGSLLSNVGTWMQNTAQVLLAYQLTHSVLAVGVVTCAQFAGSLFLGPWAAVVASRIGGRRILIITQVISAGIAFGLAELEWAGALREGLLVAGALGLGLAFTFALPIQTTLVSRLVPEADTEAAMTMNSVSYNTGRAAAPVFCVIVITTIGFGWAFALNAISFVVFAAMLALMRPGQERRQSQPSRLWDGVRIALVQPRIALLLAMVATVTIADDPVLVLGPALAQHVLGASKDWAAFFLAALGFGTVLGSLAPIASNRRTTSHTSRRAAVPLLVLAGAIVVFAAGLSTWVSLLAAVTAGGAVLVTTAATQTLLVRQCPQHAASVMALWAIAWAGTKPLASLVDGWLASTLGILPAAILLVIPALLLGIFEICLPPGAKERIKQRARTWGRSAVAAPTPKQTIPTG
jgi:predicted MFS family arabinose efflux permease